MLNNSALGGVSVTTNEDRASVDKTRLAFTRKLNELCGVLAPEVATFNDDSVAVPGAAGDVQAQIIRPQENAIRAEHTVPNRKACKRFRTIILQRYHE